MIDEQFIDEQSSLCGELFIQSSPQSDDKPCAVVGTSNAPVAPSGGANVVLDGTE